MSALQRCKQSGILLVVSCPTSSQYIGEIEEWYDTEHGPARLKLGDDYFLNGYRFRSIDDETSWLAIYDMRRLSAGARDAYTSLRANRSMHEQEIFRNKLNVKSRQFLGSVADTGPTFRAAGVLYVIWFEVGDGEVQLGKWYCSEIFDAFAANQCSRSRLFQLVEGTGADKDRAMFVGIHDYVVDSERLEPAEMVRVRTRIQEQDHVLSCSRMHAFGFENEFSAQDYQPAWERNKQEGGIDGMTAL